MRDDLYPPPVARCCPDPDRCIKRNACRFAARPGSTVTQRSFARGERIPAGAGGCVHIHVVRSGMAAASAVMRDGRRQLMCFHVPGDVICPFGVRDAECWAEALTATETWEIDLGCSARELLAEPEVSALLFDLTHTGLARSLTHVVMLGRLDGTERLVAFLTDLARRTGRRRNGAWQLSLPMSREDIADYLGLNAETVSRILSRIKKSGLARFRSPTECEIPDLALLAAQAPLAAPEVARIPAEVRA